MSQFPDYATGGVDDWTRGFRAAWFYFRSGLAWWLIEKALQTFPTNDPDRLAIATAVQYVATTRLRREPR